MEYLLFFLLEVSCLFILFIYLFIDLFIYSFIYLYIQLYTYIYLNMVKTKERLYTIFCGVATCHMCQKECTNRTMWNSCIVLYTHVYDVIYNISHVAHRPCVVFFEDVTVVCMIMFNRIYM